MPHDTLLLFLLRQTGLFTEAQLETFADAERPEGETVGQTIARLGFAGEEEFLRAAAKLLGMEYLPVSDLDASRELVDLLPAHTAAQYNVAPVRNENGLLTVVTCDPFDTRALDGLRIACGRPVDAVVCASEDVAKFVRKCYGVGAAALDKMIKEGRYEADDATDFSKFDVGSEEGQEAAIVRFVNSVIAEADRQGATDIHIEPMEHELRIRYRIDGMLHKVDVPPQLQKVQAAVISRIKVMSNLDIAEKRLPMDGRIGIHANGKEIDIRVSTCPVPYGESISLRLLQKSGAIVRFEDLGMGGRDHKVIDRTIHRPNGLLLVTGPTGSGKSTSLYAFLHEINTIDKRIMTAEDPIEYEMPGIIQTAVRSDIGLTFARLLRSFLRQDPDVMMVGEIRDGETAQIAVQASLTGHLVFSTLHTNDAASAFARLTDMGVEPYLIASSVAAVLAQRLIRRLCPACKEEVQADPAALRELDVDPTIFAGKTLRGPVGCEKCGKSGYKGRGAIFEVLAVTDGIQSLVTSRAPSGDIKDLAMKEGMLTLRDDGWRKVFEGFTTIDEVLRVTEDQAE